MMTTLEQRCMESNAYNLKRIADSLEQLVKLQTRLVLLSTDEKVRLPASMVGELSKSIKEMNDGLQ